MYWLLKTLAAGIGRLGTRSVELLAWALAMLVFDVLRLRRALVLRNLRLAFPDMTEAARVKVGRASLYNFALTSFELFRSGRHDIAAAVTIQGEEHIRTALAQGRGVYILCFHLGNWEAMGAACNRQLAPSYVLVKKVGSGGVNRFVSELRERNRFLIVKREKKGDGLTAIRDILKRGEIVGFVMDQARPGEPKLPFFGHPAKTNTSLAAIWRRYPAPIVPACITRTGLGVHVLTFYPELDIKAGSNAATDILEHSVQFNAVVETHVKEHPEQYFWVHNRWK